MNELVSVESPLSQHEVDSTFNELTITTLLDLNEQIASSDMPAGTLIDLQADTVTDLRRQRDELLERLLEDPARLFDTHFSLLKNMYDGRTFTETDYTGVRMDQFVTRDPSRSKADLHFRELEYASGVVERVVEVPQRDEPGLPFFISLKDGNLRIAASVYRRGRYDRIEIEADSDRGMRLMNEFFTHAIVASDLVYQRTPEEAAEADAQAKRFLAHKLIEQRTLN